MRYTRFPRGSTAAASCLNTPIAGWLTALRRPVGSHSHTRPSSTSSQDSQVPQGVPPPEQFWAVPLRIRYASATCPRRSKRIAEAPPWRVSEFETRIQPPSSSGNVADPSDASCQR